MADLEFRTKMNFDYGVAREIAPELAPGVLRVVANNPSPFTFKGTNTYIVGTAELAVIDPGPDDPVHCEAVVRAIAGRPVSHIVLTHTHHDHYDGLDRLQDTLQAKVCGYGREAPAASSKSPVDGGERADRSFRPDVVLRHDQTIEGDGWALTALFTPGHAPDHLCFVLGGPDRANGGATGVTFSGDHVMAWNTSVVAPPEGRMSDYLASLQRLEGRGARLYLPGHGGKLKQPERMVHAYLVHRNWRENAIYSAIQDGHRTIVDIVNLVYPGIDRRLVRAASLSVQAHVEHLIEQNRILCDGPVTFDRQLSVA